MANILVANIPDLIDPANPERIIKLREATTQQALKFSGLNPKMEEASLTAFLNEIQDPATASNAQEWTAQTRNLALFWYAIQTLEDAKTTADYRCENCGEWHSYRYDLRNIAGTYKTIEGKGFREITFNDELIRISPLLGADMENLEEARLGLEEGEALTEEQEKHNRELLAHIRFRFLVLSIDYPHDTTTDVDERFKRKESKLLALTQRQREYVTEAVYQAQADMEHGLAIHISEEGEQHLDVGSHPCPNVKEGEAFATTLRVPFRNYAVIPVL